VVLQSARRLESSESVYKSVPCPSFLTLPNSACATPTPKFFDHFNGVTIAVAALVVYMTVFWALGDIYMRFSSAGWSVESRIKFGRKSLRRILLVLTVAYAPVTEITLAMFSCRLIGASSYLREEPMNVCFSGSSYSGGDSEYIRLRKVASFWCAVFVVGVPIGFYCIMRYYNIKAVAHDMKNNARLRAVIDYALLRHLVCADNLRMPSCAATLANVPDVFVEELFVGMSELMYTTAKNMLHAKNTLTREQKMKKLTMFASQFLISPPISWHEAALDPRFEGAAQAIGPLFEGAEAIASYPAEPNSAATHRI